MHAGPLFSNGNTYYLLEDANWRRSRAAALARGGDQATVNDAAEIIRLRDTLSSSESPALHLWLGLSEKGHEGEYTGPHGDPARPRAPHSPDAAT